MISHEEAVLEALLEKSGVNEIQTSMEMENELDIETDEELMYMVNPQSQVITEGGFSV